jgi:hypothetical protein
MFECAFPYAVSKHTTHASSPDVPVSTRQRDRYLAADAVTDHEGKSLFRPCT